MLGLPTVDERVKQIARLTWRVRQINRTEANRRFTSQQGVAAMTGLDTVEMLAFSLKLIGKKTRKSVLISAGKPADKEKMFPAIEKLSKLNVSIFATPGTYRFLKEKGISNQELHKIA